MNYLKESKEIRHTTWGVITQEITEQNSLENIKFEYKNGSGRLSDLQKVLTTKFDYVRIEDFVPKMIQKSIACYRK